MEMAKNIEKLMKSQGMSTSSFAKKCGLPYSTVYSILKNGAVHARIKNVLIMCDVLGTSIEEVYTLPEKKK